MRFSKISFQNKIFLAYSSVISLLLILQAALLYVYISKTVNKATIKDAVELTARISQQLDFKVHELSNISEGLLINGEFIKILQNGPAKDSMQYLEYTRKMENIMNTLNTPSILAKRILVFQEASSTVYHTGRPIVGKSEVFGRFGEISWKNELDNSKGEKLIIPTHPNDWSPNRELCFSVARNIYDQNKHKIGVVEVQQDYSHLASICSVDIPFFSVLVLNNRGQPLYPVVPQNSTDEENYAGYIERISSSRETGSFEFSTPDNRKQLVAYSTSRYSGWTVFIKLNNEAGLSGTKSILMLNIVLFLVLILGFLNIIMGGMARYLLRPLKELTNSVEMVSLDNMEIQLRSDEYGKDEISFLNNAFKKMFSNLEQSMAQVVESQTNEVKAQIYALQSQMNPHFIYNTISMIESLSYTAGNDKAAEMCMRFSSMLRYVSSFENNVVTLKQEMDNVKSYAVLLKCRYEDYLVFSLDIDPAALEIRVPKMIVQPLVENAVEHGLFHINPPWYIKVQIMMEGNALVACVRDNGCGISEKRMAQIQETLEKCNKKLNGYGKIKDSEDKGLAIANIYTRLKLFYGDNFSMDFKNEDPAGCCVVLKIENILERNDEYNEAASR